MTLTEAKRNFRPQEATTYNPHHASSAHRWKKGLRIALLATSALGLLACSDQAPSANKPDAAAVAAASTPVASERYDPDFIGHSIDTLLIDVPPPLARVSRPLPDGTPREILTITRMLTMEAVGDPDLLQRYSLVFTFSPQDQATSMQTGLQLARIISNTFPGWKDGDGGVNPVRWLRTATSGLGDNIQKDVDHAQPVEMTREGLRVRYGVVPGQVRYVIDVTPAGAT